MSDAPKDLAYLLTISELEARLEELERLASHRKTIVEDLQEIASSRLDPIIELKNKLQSLQEELDDERERGMYKSDSDSYKNGK